MQLICELDPFQWFNDHACSRVKACTMYIFNAKLKCSKTRFNAFILVGMYYIGGSTGNWTGWIPQKSGWNLKSTANVF